MNVHLDKLIKLPMPKQQLFNLAYKVWQTGYYTAEDFVKFLLANKINIF